MFFSEDFRHSSRQLRICRIIIQPTLDISNCQGTNKFVRDIGSSSYRVVILCKLIRMGLIVLFETSRVREFDLSSIRYIEIRLYKKYNIKNEEAPVLLLCYPKLSFLH